MGQDSTVGIAICYELDDPGIKSREGREFPGLSRPVLVPTQPPVKLVPRLMSGGKAAGAGVDRYTPPQFVKYGYRSPRPLKQGRDISTLRLSSSCEDVTTLHDVTNSLKHYTI